MLAEQRKLPGESKELPVFQVLPTEYLHGIYTGRLAPFRFQKHRAACAGILTNIKVFPNDPKIDLTV